MKNLKMKCSYCGGLGQVPHHPDGDPHNAAECEVCWHCAGTGEVPDSGAHMTESAVISEMRLWLERGIERARLMLNRAEDSHDATGLSAESGAYSMALCELNRLRCYLGKGK